MVPGHALYGSQQALDLIGKEIEAEGDILSLEQGRLSTGSFTLGSQADCTILIRDSDGHPVREIYLGALGPGEHSFEWDGRDMEGSILDWPEDTGYTRVC